MGIKDFCGSLVGLVFVYDTPKIVHVESVRVGILFRLVQLLIIGYIVGFAIVYKKGYQEFDVALSTVVSKVKGTAYTPDYPKYPRGYRNKVWDSADYVIPPQETDATFVLTNAIITAGQKQGICAEDYAVSGARCNSTKPCKRGKMSPNGNGVMTGECVEFYNTGNYTCQIKAWCPVENDTLVTPFDYEPLLEEALDFTILVKNFIEFPKFGKRLRNVIDNHSVDEEKHLKNCKYDENKDPLCPIFRIGDILNLTNQINTSILITGGVIGISITWDCNFDYSISYCKPQYHISRLDDEKTKLAPGWNFRFANHYSLADGTQARDLIKAYGILFVFNVNAKAGRFSVVPLALNIGSGLALLSLASIACDFVLLRLHKKRKYYRNEKFHMIKDLDRTRTGDSCTTTSSHVDDLHESGEVVSTPHLSQNAHSANSTKHA